MKSILVTNYHLDKVGGSETFTYALIEGLVQRGFEVEYFTFFKGFTSERIERDLEVKFMSRKKYDLILANHRTCVQFLSPKGLLIQTCHGVFPSQEQPSKYADGHISISQEVQEHLKNKGFNSEIIVNGINCERFKPEIPVGGNLRKVLSLCQSESANSKIRAACEALELKFAKFNKNENPVWDIEKMINQSDLVLGLGRSAYEAMACGRPVIIFDERTYFDSFSDGYMTADLVKKCVINNCSGRHLKLKFNHEDLILEFKKYRKEDGDDLRNLMLKDFSIDIQIDRYLQYARTLTKRHFKLKLLYANWRCRRKLRKRRLL